MMRMIKVTLLNPPDPVQTCSPCPLPCQRDLHRQTVDQSPCQSPGLQQVSARRQLPQSPLPRRGGRAFLAGLVQCGSPLERKFLNLRRSKKSNHLTLHKTGGAILFDELSHNKPNVLTTGETRQEEEFILPASEKLLQTSHVPPFPRNTPFLQDLLVSYCSPRDELSINRAHALARHKPRLPTHADRLPRNKDWTLLEPDNCP